LIIPSPLYQSAGNQKIKRQKAKGKGQKAKVPNEEPMLTVFIFAFCLLPFAF
jgi:hypothetical protein